MGANPQKCPHCGNHLAPVVVDPVADLRRRCAEHGQWVSPTDEVNEATAAELVGRSAGTLRNWRGLNPTPLNFRTLRGRVLYTLNDIADFMTDQN